MIRLESFEAWVFSVPHRRARIKEQEKSRRRHAYWHKHSPFGFHWVNPYPGQATRPEDVPLHDPDADIFFGDALSNNERVVSRATPALPSLSQLDGDDVDD